jgi:hypothetical protein
MTQEQHTGALEPHLVTGAELAVIHAIRAKHIQPTAEMVADILARRANPPENDPDQSRLSGQIAQRPPTAPVRKPRGRPPKEPPWLQEAAKMVAEGLTQRKALRRLGVELTTPERKNIYRWRRFRLYVERHRRATLTSMVP